MLHIYLLILIYNHTYFMYWRHQTPASSIVILMYLGRKDKQTMQYSMVYVFSRFTCKTRKLYLISWFIHVCEFDLCFRVVLVSIQITLRKHWRFMGMSRSQVISWPHLIGELRSTSRRYDASMYMLTHCLTFIWHYVWHILVATFSIIMLFYSSAFNRLTPETIWTTWRSFSYTNTNIGTTMQNMLACLMMRS